MAEDVEIEYLLKENEQILEDAANFAQKPCLANENQTNLKCARTTYHESDDDELDLEDQLDDHLLQYKTKGNPKFVYSSTALDSPFEDESDFDEISEDENLFINEILPDDEPRFRGRGVEEIKKKITSSSSQVEKHTASLGKLFDAHKLLTDQMDLATAGIEKLLQELNENLESQKQIRDKLESLSSKPGPSMREPSFTKCFFKIFGMPYFEDYKGFTPPPNEDTKQKLERGEILLSTLPKMHYWIKPHKKQLQESIRETLIKENRERLLNETRKIEQKLTYVSDEEEKCALKDLRKCQSELRKLKTISFLDLVMKENPDREYDWLKYHATVFKGLHSAEECKRFWHVYLKPCVNKCSWEPDEDFRLSNLAAENNFEDWDTIAKNLGTNRTAYQCFVHYHTQISASQDYTYGKWTLDEDNHLISVVNASRWGDYIPWAKVAAHIPNRTRSQIYNRWYNSLNPTILKGRFTREEDLLLLAGVEVYGLSFKEMSAFLKNRTPNQLKERFERYLRPKTRTSGIWSLEEDKKLLELVGVHGDHNWVKISNAMRTRCRTQVRQRYKFIQLSLKKNSSWTPENIRRRKKTRVNSCTRLLKQIQEAKQEMQEIERTFKLSPVEKETLCIEKLTELRDKVFMKKYDVKSKKEYVPEISEEDHRLLTFLSLSTNPKTTIKAEYVYNLDKVGSVEEIGGLERLFKTKLGLPLSKDEIKNNISLKTRTKAFLLNTIEERTLRSNQNNSVKELLMIGCTTTGDNLDYTPPEFDDTLEKPEWLKTNEWYDNPPVDVKRLNFSEFFKRTVFDYSSGMHKEIWEAKANRTYTFNPSCQLDQSLSSTAYHPKSVFIAPSALTTEAMKSSILTRQQLGSRQQIITFEAQSREAKLLLDLYQNLLNSLLLIPRLMSFNGLTMTPLQEVCSSTTDKKQSSLKNILTLLEEPPPDEDSGFKKTLKGPVTHSKLQKQKMKETIIKHNRVRKCQIDDYKKGIRFKKKVNLDHLILRNKCSKKKALKDSSNILSRGSKQVLKVKITKNATTSKKPIKTVKEKVSKSEKDGNTQGIKLVDGGSGDNQVFKVRLQEEKVNRTKDTKNTKTLITKQIEKFKEQLSKSGNQKTIQVNSLNFNSGDNQGFEVLKFNLPKVTYKRRKRQEQEEQSSMKRRKLSTSHDVGGK